MDTFLLFFARIALLAPAFLVAIAVHEYAHALVAHWLGDDTAKNMGRLTLNPFKHLDPLGLLMLFLVGVGWANPVIFDERNFKRPRLYSLCVAYAGPFTNILAACVFIYCMQAAVVLSFDPKLMSSVYNILSVAVDVNIMLAIFNLLPIPPLDGSHIIRVLLPQRLLPYYYVVARFSIFFWIIFLFIPATRFLFAHALVATRMFLQHLLIG